MDAYLVCRETKRYMWLGKPIRFDDEQGREYVAYFSQNAEIRNHQNQLLNTVLWKFLAEHARNELQILFSGEFDNSGYDCAPTSDIEAEDYIRDWPPEQA